MAEVGVQDPWYQVSQVVGTIRSGRAQTRPSLVEATGLGRNVVAARLKAAHDLGLIEAAGSGPSRGGRAADLWRFNGGVGHVLVGTVGVRTLRVAIAALDGTVIESRSVPWEVERGPQETCARIADEMDVLLKAVGASRAWAVSIGMPAPVNFITGMGADPVAAAEPDLRWPNDFDVRAWFAERFDAPVWAESVSNLFAIGAASAQDAPEDLVFVRLGTGIGAGLVSRGRLHRGADWLAGELSHVNVRDDADRICLCGRIGCLDAYAGGWALIGDAQRAAGQGRSAFLAERAAERPLVLGDLVDGSRQGEPACVEIVVRAAEALGRALAPMVTWFNPAQVVVGGFPIVQDPRFLTVVDRAVRANALDASTANLVIRAGDPEQREGIAGAVEVATDAILSPGYLVEWGPLGSPLEAAELRHRVHQV